MPLKMLEIQALKHFSSKHTFVYLICRITHFVYMAPMRVYFILTFFELCFIFVCIFFAIFLQNKNYFLLYTFGFIYSNIPRECECVSTFDRYSKRNRSPLYLYPDWCALDFIFAS